MMVRWSLAALLIACAAAQNSIIQLDDVMSVMFTTSPDRSQATFTVTALANTFLAFGVSTDGSMFGPGAKGADAYICSDGVVQLYWISDSKMPVAGKGEAVADSTCTHTDGKSQMKFTRTFAEQKNKLHPISTKGLTTFIFARGTSPTLGYHGTTKGAVAYDVLHPSKSSLVVLDDNLSATLVTSGDGSEVTFRVTAVNSTWIGVGVSLDGTMTSSGAGSTAFICSNGAVLHYNITEKAPPSGGVEVAGTSCEQTAGSTTMIFTRKLESPNMNPLSRDGPTQIIWAYGTTPDMEYHQASRGATAINVLHPPAPAPTSPAHAPTAAAPTPQPPGSRIVFDEVMSATYTVAKNAKNEKTVTFTVTALASTWMGIGVSVDGTMIGKTGSSAFICSDGVVQQYWMVARQPPTNGVAVPGSSCRQADGKSSMTFTTPFEGAAKRIPISTTGATDFIWAYGTTPTLAFHGPSCGTVSWDVCTGGGEALKYPPSLALWAHMFLMLFSWGGLLPFGVVFARYHRKNPSKLAGKPIWFNMHRLCQSTGVLFQLSGLACALVLVDQADMGHFTGAYVVHKIGGLIVVILGTAQPFIACLRPPAHQHHDPARGCGDKRVLWECVHKGVGYVAVLGGAANVCYGAFIAHQKMYDDAFTLTAAVIAIVFLSPLLVYAAVKEVAQKCNSAQSIGYTQII